MEYHWDYSSFEHSMGRRLEDMTPAQLFAVSEAEREAIEEAGITYLRTPLVTLVNALTMDIHDQVEQLYHLSR